MSPKTMRFNEFAIVTVKRNDYRMSFVFMTESKSLARRKILI